MTAEWIVDCCPLKVASGSRSVLFDLAAFFARNADRMRFASERPEPPEMRSGAESISWTVGDSSIVPRFASFFGETGSDDAVVCDSFDVDAQVEFDVDLLPLSIILALLL